MGSSRNTFAIKEIKNVDKVTFDYNWECDDNQNTTECKCGQRIVNGLLKEFEQE